MEATKREDTLSEADQHRNPRLKSALDEYSQIYDDLKKERLSKNNVSLEVLEPKNELINGMVIQHLLQKEFNETFRNLQQDIATSKSRSNPRVFEDQSSELKDAMFKAFYKGNEKDFFKCRTKLYDELNYYKLDYKLNDATELKTRAYFAVFYLIPMNKKKVGPVDDRCQSKTQ